MRGDPFEDIRSLVDKVHAYVAYRIGPGPDAEDITNEVFERALRYRDSYDPRKGEPTAWLIGIARRCVEGRHISDASGAAAADRDAGFDLDGSVVRRLELRSAVETLDGRSRELIALRYGADLSAREIAQLLDVRTNTVEVALHRALARLRDQLEPPRQHGVEPAPRRG